MDYNLNRFIEAQKEKFNTALVEIKNGYKVGHWMWYIFPQLKGLGMSDMAEYYGIDGIEEAQEYLNNNYLRNNLLRICSELLLLESNDAKKIFGFPDNLKLKSCMTLFSYINPDETIYKEVLNKFYNGEMDERTIKMLNQ